MDETVAVATKHAGSCHCGAVRFEAEIDMSKGASRCNCTVCTKTSVAGAICKPAAFKLLTDEASLTVYEFAARMSRRYFCKLCGVQCFGRGHLDVLGGDYVSVNLNCLDDADVQQLKTVHWDGRHNNWAAGPRDTPWPI